MVANDDIQTVQKNWQNSQAENWQHTTIVHWRQQNAVWVQRLAAQIVSWWWLSQVLPAHPLNTVTSMQQHINRLLTLLEQRKPGSQIDRVDLVLISDIHYIPILEVNRFGHAGVAIVRSDLDLVARRLCIRGDPKCQLRLWALHSGGRGTGEDSRSLCRSLWTHLITMQECEDSDIQQVLHHSQEEGFGNLWWVPFWDVWLEVNLVQWWSQLVLNCLSAMVW